LTTLHVNQNYIGKLAMRTLLEIMMGESSPTAMLIEPELLLRESA
jgi:DNA-binding LacI/PurR family transcriptional regulator